MPSSKTWKPHKVHRFICEVHMWGDIKTKSRSTPFQQCPPPPAVYRRLRQELYPNPIFADMVSRPVRGGFRRVQADPDPDPEPRAPTAPLRSPRPIPPGFLGGELRLFAPLGCAMLGSRASSGRHFFVDTHRVIWNVRRLTAPLRWWWVWWEG